MGQAEGRWRANGIRGVDLTGCLPFIISERKDLVLNDGAAECTTVAIEVEPRIKVAGDSVCPVRDTLETGDGIQVAILKILVNSTMDAVSAGFDDRVELSAGGVTVLRGVNIFE